MFFCFLHELGHIVTGIILKMKVEKIELMPCGLSSSFKTNFTNLNYNKKNENVLVLKEIIIAMGGPLCSLILTLLCIYIDIPYVTKQDAVFSNFLIFVFNLIPLYPLDGGRIVKGILHICFGSEQSVKLTKKISNISIIVITIISSIAVYYFKNIAIFLVCIFLWFIKI